MNNFNDYFFFNKFIIGDFFLLPKGLYVKNKLKKILTNIRLSHKCIEIETPTIINGLLWKKTGHLDFFSDNMFLFGNKDSKNKNQIIGFKPMSCPGSVFVFNHLVDRSYKKIPFRTFEFGVVFRKELSGTLSTMKRLMKMTQDDSHIFLSQEFLFEEIDKICKSIVSLYKKFDLPFKIYLSDKPTKYIGNENEWKICIDIFKKILEKNNLNYILSNSGAFYGPKIDFCIIDNQKEWQCGTIQLDFYLCKNLNAYYKNQDNKKIHPIVIHSALVGTIERFLSVLMDIKKKFPFFLSPNAVKINILNDSLHNSKSQEILLTNVKKSLNEIDITFNVFNIKENFKENLKDFNKYNFIINIMKNNEKIILINCKNKSKIICDVDKLKKILNIF
jgi:threonyl-tRNA synthetase